MAVIYRKKSSIMRILGNALKVCGGESSFKEKRYSLAYPMAPAEMDGQSFHGFKRLLAFAAGIDFLWRLCFFFAQVHLPERVVYRVFHGDETRAALARGIGLADADILVIMHVVAVRRGSCSAGPSGFGSLWCSAAAGRFCSIPSNVLLFPASSSCTYGGNL